MNRRARHKMHGNREILRKLNGSFTAPILKSPGFCFASVISLNDLNDLRTNVAQSLNMAGREHAVRKPESNHCFEIFDQTSYAVNLR